MEYTPSVRSVLNRLYSPLPYATHCTGHATPRLSLPLPALRRPCMYSSHAVPCLPSWVGGVMVGNGQSGERHSRCHSVKLPYGVNFRRRPWHNASQEGNNRAAQFLRQKHKAAP